MTCLTLSHCLSFLKAHMHSSMHQAQISLTAEQWFQEFPISKVKMTSEKFITNINMSGRSDCVTQQLNMRVTLAQVTGLLWWEIIQMTSWTFSPLMRSKSCRNSRRLKSMELISMTWQVSFQEATWRTAAANSADKEDQVKASKSATISLQKVLCSFFSIKLDFPTLGAFYYWNNL